MYITGNTLNWLNKAINPNNKHDYIRNIYCDGEYLIATDSNRLHYIPAPPSYKIGYYNKDAKLMRADGRVFVNWQRIIPADLECTWFTLSNVPEGVFYKLPNGLTVMRDYLLQAMGDSPYITIGYTTDSNHKLAHHIRLLLPENKKAVIYAF